MDANLVWAPALSLTCAASCPASWTAGAPPPLPSGHTCPHQQCSLSAGLSSPNTTCSRRKAEHTRDRGPVDVSERDALAETLQQQPDLGHV
eukprot:2995427-Rhodomonas_salina.1